MQIHATNGDALQTLDCPPEACDLTLVEYRNGRKIEMRAMAFGKGKRTALTRKAKPKMTATALRKRHKEQTATVAKMKQSTSDPSHGFGDGERGWGKFAQEIMRVCQDGAHKFSPTVTATSGEGPGGGFALAPNFRQEIENIIQVRSLAPLCDNIMTESNTFIVADATDVPWAPGGISMSWDVGEGEQKSQRKPQLAQFNLKLNKLTGLVPISSELAEDSPALGAYLRDGLGNAISHYISLAILQGTGVGQPLGILTSNCLITLAKEGSQAADSIVAENLRGMVARCHVNDPTATKWIVSPSAKRDITEDLTQIPYHQERDRLWLHGYEVLVSQAAEQIGDVGDIVLGDFSQFRLVQKAPQIAQSVHLFFDWDAMAFRFILRIAGMPKWPEAVSSRDGSVTVSPFVSLAVRS